MRSGDVVSGVVLFFNDVIGAVVPGAILVISLGASGFLGAVGDGGYGFPSWVAALVVAYAAGHGLLSVDRILRGLASRIWRAVRARCKSGESGNVSDKDSVRERWAYQAFVKRLGLASGEGTHSLSTPTFHEVRSVAMSISTEAGELARRFMFISLFCYGVATAVLVVCLINAAVHVASTEPSWMVWLGAAFPLYGLFLVRGKEFERRARYVPFAVALGSMMRGRADESDG